MNLTLVQRSMQREAAPPVTAWFLAGDSAARWVDELTRCGLADAGTRLFLVPRSLSDRSPAGLLVVPEDRRQPVHPPAGLPCRTVADRLFVPLEADLEPPATDAEVRQLCPMPVTFCHPALGPSGFGDESTLRVWDLLELPEERVE